jgi:hypothetical protein
MSGEDDLTKKNIGEGVGQVFKEGGGILNTLKNMVNGLGAAGGSLLGQKPPGLLEDSNVERLDQKKIPGIFGSKKGGGRGR